MNLPNHSLPHTVHCSCPWQNLVQNLPDYACFWLDEEGRILSWNSGATTLFGYTPEMILGQPVDTLYEQEARQRREPEQARQVARISGWASASGRRRHANGQVLRVDSRLYRLTIPNEPALYCEFARDASQEYRVQDTLRATEERLRQVVETSPNGLLLFDTKGRITFASRAAGRILGSTTTELVGKRFDAPEWEVTDLAEVPCPAAGFAFLPVRRTGTPVTDTQFRITRRDGLRIALSVSAAPLEGPLAGSASGVLVWLSDITSRLATEEARKQQVHLQAFSRGLVQQQEDERRRIACELHDEVGETLTGLKLLLEAGDDPARHRALALTQELMARVRQMSLDLRPSLLDDLGLKPALNWLFRRHAEQHNLMVEFSATGWERRFPTDLETAIYRVVQESLTNVLRYAGTCDVTVHGWADEHRLGVRITDQGVGFDPDQVRSGRASTGVSGMRERVLLLGGAFSLTSAPHAGTSIHVELPLFD